MLYGSHQLFAAYSYWLLFAILFVSTNAFVLTGRKVFEGEAYNVSWSSIVGGAALIGCMAIAGQILHQPTLALPDWLASGWLHGIVAAISITAASLMTRTEIQRITWARMKFVDRVFNLFIGPVFIYLCLTLVPVTLFRGNIFAVSATAGLLVSYFVTVKIDTTTGRIHQPEWREKHPGHNFLW